jgi:hypothetical protein
LKSLRIFVADRAALCESRFRISFVWTRVHPWRRAKWWDSSQRDEFHHPEFSVFSWGPRNMQKSAGRDATAPRQAGRPAAKVVGTMVRMERMMPSTVLFFREMLNLWSPFVSQGGEGEEFASAGVRRFRARTPTARTE